MESHDLLAWILIGLIAGALASRLVEGRGLGFLLDLAVGIAGAVIGGILLHQLEPGARYGLLGSTVVAFIGASLFLGVLRMLGVRRGTPLQRLRRHW